ncbi:MAG: hypothetical protein QW613_05445 [Thermoprotei archaeon]
MPPITVVDSSLMIEADRRGVLDELEIYLRENISVSPPRVFEETVTEARKVGYVDSANRIEGLFNTGALRVVEPDYSDHKISRIVDGVRECIARKSCKPIHMVERTDLDIVVLAAGYAKAGAKVILIFRDKALRECLELELARQKIFGVMVVDFARLVDELTSRSRRR